MLTWIACFVVLLAHGSVWTRPPAWAEDAGEPVPTRVKAPPTDALHALTQRVNAALESAHVEAVRAPAEQAKLALQRAESAKDPGTKERALAVARAAVALAEARSALLHESELSASAARRRIEAKGRAEQAHTALLRTQKAVSGKANQQP